MKKVLIGGFISLLGTIWGLAVIIFTSNNLVSSWPTLLGRFFTTVSELGMTVPFVISILFVVLGLVVMAVEYFKKDN